MKDCDDPKIAVRVLKKRVEAYLVSCQTRQTPAKRLKAVNYFRKYFYHRYLIGPINASETYLWVTTIGKKNLTDNLLISKGKIFAKKIPLIDWKYKQIE